MKTLDHSLTPRELAVRWRCRTQRVRLMIVAGTLPAIHLDGRVRITPEAIAEAERGELAVRPAKRKRVDRVDPEIARLLEA